MKRYYFSQYTGLEDLLVKPSSADPLEKPVNANQNEVFNLIYGADPVTCRPRSDLGTYLGDNTNPLVRDFIERQLRTDFSGNSAAVPDGLTDADLAVLTRDTKETVEEYSARLNSYMGVQKEIFRKAQYMKKQKAKADALAAQIADFERLKTE